MPRPASDSAGSAIDPLSFLGVPGSAPSAPAAGSSVISAPSITPQAPIVSSTPSIGQGIATDTSGALPVTVAAQVIPITSADPVAPVVGQIWYRKDTSQLSIRHDGSTTKRVSLA